MSSLRNSKVAKWAPIGLSDALESEQAFPGAMMFLQDLIPDPSTKGLWQCRPGSVLQTNFAAFANVGAVSVFKVVGSQVFGLVGTSLNGGRDQPFCYNLANGTLISVGNITLANVPLTQSQQGDWVPPTMDLIGTKLIVTSPGFVGTPNAFGFFDLSVPGQVTWGAGNTAVNPLPSPPTAVLQFNQRAYYLCNPPGAQPGLLASDELDALTMTNGTFVLTFGDNLPLTAIGGLPLNNQLGGIIQSAIVFKGVTNMYQVTGDPTGIPSAWTVNTLNVATGTLSPRSICPTPKGLAFMSPDGVRLIDFNAHVSDPIGFAGSGVTVPFLNLVTPSRLVAACNASVLRISTQTNTAGGIVNQEFWYDIPRQIWSGPHSFPASEIAVSQNTFIVTPRSVPGSLWQSDVIQSPSSQFVENAVQLTWKWQSCLMPDIDEMCESTMIETTLNVANVATATGAPDIQTTAFDQDGVTLGTAALPATGKLPVWGAAVFGVDLWGGARKALAPLQLQWAAPVTFRRLSVCATGTSSPGIKIGTLYLRYQPLGYLQQ